MVVSGIALFFNPRQELFPEGLPEFLYRVGLKQKANKCFILMSLLLNMCFIINTYKLFKDVECNYT